MLDAIIIVAGGILQIPAVEEARKLKLKTIVTDGNKNAICSNLADQFYKIDIYNIPKHFELIKKIMNDVNIKGVFTEGSEATITVAELAKYLDLKGISPESARNCKDKIMTRRILEKHKIPIPRWKQVTKKSISSEAKTLGFPIIIKSSNNSGSRGSTKVSDAKGLLQAYNLAKKNSTNSKVLIEELLYGDEQSVEILFDHNKKCIFLNIVDRYFSEGKWSIELGHVNPTRLNKKTQKELFELTKKSAKSMNIDFGVFKADTIITKDGIKILEVTPRLSGGFDSQKTTPISSGRNFIKAAMTLALNMPIEKNDLIHKKKKFSAVWTVLPNPGKIKMIKGVDIAKRLKGVKEIIIMKQKNDKIPKIIDSAKRPAYVISEASSYNQALNIAKKAATKIQFMVEKS
jgi:biotin carboxylase|tara:strand:- start:1932 stop:3140 length:1209 start_codon:yes stop_codon:yes gene_type:complete